MVFEFQMWWNVTWRQIHGLVDLQQAKHFEKVCHAINFGHQTIPEISEIIGLV